jgi:hypothetical protein
MNIQAYSVFWMTSMAKFMDVSTLVKKTRHVLPAIASNGVLASRVTLVDGM